MVMVAGRLNGLPEQLPGDMYDILVVDIDGGNTTMVSDGLIIDLDGVVNAPADFGNVTRQLATNDQTPILSGTATADTSITLEVGTAKFSVPVDDMGDWVFTLPLTNEGLYRLAIVEADGDTTEIQGGLLIDVTSIVGNGAFAGVAPLVSTSANPQITGTSTPDESVTVVIDGQTINTTADDSGNWIAPVPTGLADDVYDVLVTNSLGYVTQAFDIITVDTTPPLVPTVVTQITNDTTPVITGTAVGADDLMVTVNGETYQLTNTELSIDGSGNWILDLSSLAPVLDEDDYDVAVVSTDAAGNNSSIPGTDALIIDTTPPSTPTVVAQITNDTTPMITGTAVGADDLMVTVNGETYELTDSELSIDGSGNWILDLSSLDPVLDEDDYDVAVVSTDAAGNSSSIPGIDALMVDTTPPSLPTVVAQITNDTTPVITGTAVGADDLMVTVNGETYELTDSELSIDSSGNWVLDLSSLDPVLDEDDYDVAVVSTDAAGNSSSIPGIDALMVDTTPPSTPTVVAQITNDTTPVITGTAVGADDLMVTVNGETYDLADSELIIDSSGNWTLDLSSLDPVLDEDDYDVAVVSTDAAGNSSSIPGIDALIIDTTPPSLPTVVAQITNDTTPVITGSAVGADDLMVTVNGVTYDLSDSELNIDASGNWTLDLSNLDPVLDEDEYCRKY